MGSALRDAPEGLENTRHLLIVVKDETHTNEATLFTVGECTCEPTLMGVPPRGSLKKGRAGVVLERQMS